MLIKQKSCKQKEMLRKITSKFILNKSNKNIGSHLTLSKTNSLIPSYKICKGSLFLRNKLERKKLISPILFQLLNLHLWQAAHCTQHTAQCTLGTEPALAIVPAPAIAPASAPVHSYYTLNAGHCTPYNFTNCYTLIISH